MNRIRVGVVGVGAFGVHHARIYSELEGCELIGVNDINMDRCREIAARFSAVAFPTSSALMDEVDALSIATYTINHADIAIEALRSGVHVLVEKPIAESVERADEIVRAADEAGRVLAVGHLERFNAAFTAVAGKVRGLKYFRSERQGMWSGKNLDVDVVTELMIHDLDLLLHLVGSEPVEVEASGARVFSDLLDIASARIILDSGAVAVLDTSRVSSRKLREIRLFTDEEYYSIDMLNCRATHTRVPPDGEPGNLDRRELPLNKKEPLREELISFLQAIQGRPTKLASGRDARNALALAARINEAAGLIEADKTSQIPFPD